MLGGISQMGPYQNLTINILFINSGRIICHVHKTLGNLIPIKSLVCHNDRFFKVYIIKIDKGFNRHQNI